MLQFFRTICCAVLLAASNTLAQDAIYINELLAANTAVLADEAGEFDDWIELYNATDHPIDVGGWYLSDDIDARTKARLPQHRPDLTNIPPGQFLLIWADNNPEQGALHLPFRLSRNGEWLCLCRPDCTISDSLTYTVQRTDVSWGRRRDAEFDWCFFSSPTPMKTNSEGDIQPLITFLPEQGFYESALNVHVQVKPAMGQLYVNGDGWEPMAYGTHVGDAFSLSGVHVFRARVFSGAEPLTPILTQSYFVNVHHEIPVVSLVVHPDHLWNAANGIYENWQQKGVGWERPAHVTLFKDGHTVVDTDCGIRIHGGTSRRFEKKSMRLYFGEAYNTDVVRERLFPQHNRGHFDRLIFYTPSTDHYAGTGNPIYIADVLTQSLFQDMGHPVAAWQPAALYLNGNYWGLYWIRERLDDAFVREHMGIEEMDFHHDSWYAQQAEVVEGTLDYWTECLHFFYTHNMAESANYQQAIEEYIHIKSFTDYYILCIYAANGDWPHNNVDRVRDRNGDPRWRWLMWDTNEAWRHEDPNVPTLEWATRDRIRLDLSVSDTERWVESTLILRSLLKNETYRHFFINRFADLLNGLFLPDAMIERVSALCDLIRPEMNGEITRWADSQDFSLFDRQQDRLKGFLQLRHGYQRQQIVDHFSLSGVYALELNADEAQGQLRLNTLSLSHFPWQGSYFSDVPIHIEAIPKAGHVFAGWSDPALPCTSAVTLNLNDYYTLTVYFSSSAASQAIVINEINHFSDTEGVPGDWIELFNRSEQWVDLSGFVLDDGMRDHAYRFPAGTGLDADDFLVLAGDTVAFTRLFPETRFIGPFDFGLSSTGEVLRLWNRMGCLLDSVGYHSQAPWPADLVGTTHTLELKHAGLDNSLGENWQASEANGSPGAGNDTDVDSTQTNVESVTTLTCHLFQNHPNPFHAQTHILFTLKKQGMVRLGIFDTRGRCLRCLEGYYDAGQHHVLWDGLDEQGNKAASGVYLAVLTYGQARRTIKMLLLR